jgi:hypothetical protein
VDGFFLLAGDEGLGALDFFIWAAIGLKYHPASRLRWRASKRGAQKSWVSVAAKCCGDGVVD